MDLILRKGEAYGLELVRESEGLLTRGGIYVQLMRLARRGLVESRRETPPTGAAGVPRRLYRASALGVRTLQAHRAAERAAMLCFQEDPEAKRAAAGRG